MPRLAPLLLSLVLLNACTGMVRRQAGLERPDARVRRSDMVFPMADGVDLAADIYLPRGDGPWPVVLIRTPYDKRNTLQLTPILARLFAQQGYGVVVQDVRGRFASQGAWEPFYHEQQDGLQALEQVLEQPWCDGRVGTFGMSYYGFTQWALGVQAPAALQTMVPIITSTDPWSWFYTGGAYRTELGSSWALTIAEQDENRPKRAAEQDVIFSHLPPQDADEAVLATTLPFYDEWISHDTPGAPYDQWLPRDAARMAQVPALLVTGWFDIFLGGALQDFQTLSSADSPAAASHLLVGPWGHSLGFADISDVDLGDDAAFTPFLALIVSWFDVHLRGAGGQAGRLSGARGGSPNPRPAMARQGLSSKSGLGEKQGK